MGLHLSISCYYLCVKVEMYLLFHLKHMGKDIRYNYISALHITLMIRRQVRKILLLTTSRTYIDRDLNLGILSSPLSQVLDIMEDILYLD